MYTHNKSFRRTLGGPPVQPRDQGQWGVKVLMMTGIPGAGDGCPVAQDLTVRDTYWKSVDKDERNLQSYERKRIIPIIYEEVYNKWIS